MKKNENEPGRVILVFDEGRENELNVSDIIAPAPLLDKYIFDGSGEMITGDQSATPINHQLIERTNDLAGQATCVDRRITRPDRQSSVKPRLPGCFDLLEQIRNKKGLIRSALHLLLNTQIAADRALRPGLGIKKEADVAGQIAASAVTE